MAQGTNQVRIIGGTWRGRRLKFPDSQGLRPTPDRIRETLFNWLQPIISGARCLDAFAGSGVLGFEAASRGAQQVDLLEKSATVSRYLQGSRQLLDANNLYLHTTDSLKWLANPPSEPYDIIFLDPPYQAHLLAPTLSLIFASPWIKEQGLIYLETPQQEHFPELPDGWLYAREKIGGNIRYGLISHTHAKD